MAVSPSGPRLLFEVEIPGTPVPKGRPRVFQDKEGKSKTITPKRTSDWETKATAYLMKAGIRRISPGIPLWLDVECGKRETPPEAADPIYDMSSFDIDNIAKIAMDALAPSRRKKKGVWVRVARG